jgi:hypothetical protein
LSCEIRVPRLKVGAEFAVMIREGAKTWDEAAAIAGLDPQ